MDKKKQYEHIITIKNTSYKFTKATIVSACKTIEFIKGNKRVYRSLVFCFAMCLMPSFAEIGKQLFYDIVIALSQAPQDMKMQVFYDMFKQLTICVTSVVISIEILKTLMCKRISDILK